MVNPNQSASQESFNHDEMIQFSDGHIAISFKTPGDVIRWGEHKYADPQHSAIDYVIVTTESGKHLAMGSYTIIELPEFNKATGQFGVVGDKVRAARIDDVAPNGLPEIVIGEPWNTMAGESDPIKTVMLDYKLGMPDQPGYEQAGFPNPFESVRAHLLRVDEALIAQGR